jgi:predicted HTH transcriptional regulator
MIQKPLDAITEADLLALITNKVREGRTIDYKRELPGNSYADKKEFLADVSSFANTGGGDLVNGMDEDQGLPTQLTGFRCTNSDVEIQRLDSILASGLSPRIRYAARLIPCNAGLKVLVIRVERSWGGPHRVIFSGHDKFYGRNSSGDFPLDVASPRRAAQTCYQYHEYECRALH